jgi:hypothetical protein
MFSLVIVLPLLVTRLDAANIALWYLFRGVMDLQLLADVGLEATFTRVIAYAMGGAKNLEINSNGSSSPQAQPNWLLLEKICCTMNGLYLRVTLASFILFGSIGSLVLIKPISSSSTILNSWLAWGIVITSSSINLYSKRYSAYLQGVNQIALYRRWLVVTTVGEIATSFVVLLVGGGLLGLTMAVQGWKLVSLLVNRWLAREVESQRFSNFKGIMIHHVVMRAVWPSAWRSGVGRFMSYGLVQISGFVYAQYGATANIASYLLSLRMILTISEFSRAPFYTKIPALARLYSERNLNQLISWAQRGMVLAYWSFVGGFIGISLFLQPIFDLIGSNIDFVDPLLWSLLGIGFFFERYGAMHIQLYSTTNKIIWHIANGVSGLLFILLSLVLYPIVAVLAFPLGYLGGHLGFYAWYSAMHSYKTFNLRFWTFEVRTMLGPLAVLLISNAMILLTQR